MYIGELIKKYRLNHSLSMQEFANASGLSKAYIGMLEKIYNPQNKKPISPSLPKMQSIAKAMGLTIDELLPLLDDEQEVIINTSNKPEKEGVKMPRNKLSRFDKELRTQISENLKKHAGGMTQFKLSEMTGIPVSTLSGYFAMRSTPNAGNIQKIADALHINKSDLDPRFSNNILKSEANEEPELNTRDEREIESDLEDMMNSVSSAAFEGEDDIEDIEAFKATIKAAMIQAKKIAKKKYTPKKYRRD